MTDVEEIKNGLTIEWQRDTIKNCEWLHSMFFDGARIILQSGYWNDGNKIKSETKILTDEQAVEYIEKNKSYELQRFRS